MRCPHCQSDNLPDALFCSQCGTKLELVCPQCQTANTPTSKFCRKCGTPLGQQFQVPSSKFQVQGSVSDNPQSAIRNSQSPESPASYTPPHLAERIRAEQAALEARGASEGERKTITALFADITGSMQLIEDLDPEEARAIVDPVLQLMMDAVHRYEGYVAQSLGDGIFALFGAPIAHEDHPQRALYAALRMQEDGRRYAEQLRRTHGVTLQIRVGINTGAVVVRSIRKDDLHTDYVPIGYSTSLAARMESLAAPGSIVVSDQTQKLTEGYFELKPLGAAQVKGVTEPIEIYEVVGVGPLQTRLQVAARRGLAKFVGRQSELTQLRKGLELVQTGHGQVIGVMGEPGVGKSRLLHEFKLTARKGGLILETFSVAHGRAYSYLPLIELLKSYMQLLPKDDERQRQEKITGKVLTLDRSLEDTLPYLCFLLGISSASAASLSQMDPQTRRRRTFEAIKRLLARESLNQPLLLIFEDLHWVDNETQAFLDFLSESVATARILLLTNYRPEYQHTWSGKSYYTQLRLDPLGPEEAEEFLTALLGNGDIPRAAAEQSADDLLYVPLPLWLTSLRRFILEKTQGNPFFMEEMVATLIEEGVLIRDPHSGTLTPVPGVKLQDLHIPPTVQGILAARIDRLPVEVKGLLQTLSVIGKEFPFSLMRRVVEQPEEDLQRLLFHLQTTEFLHEQPTFPEPRYLFKHALTQEVAYNSLLMERRAALHERTAQAIEDLFSDELEDHYGELAHHYNRSGNVEKAIDYLQRAGEQAARRSAYAEAITHLSQALTLLKNLPETPEHIRRELLLLISLGAPLTITRGYGVPEVAAIYTRARALYELVGESIELLPVLFGLWRFYFLRGEYQPARAMVETFTRLAQSGHEPELLFASHLAEGFTLFRLGELIPALAHLERGLALCDADTQEAERSHAFLYGQDPGVMCLGYTAWALWYCGYPDQALQRSQEAIALAQELGHPASLIFSLHFATAAHRLRREGALVQQRAEEVIALASEHGFPLWLAGGTFLRGWALAEQGHSDDGIAQMRQALDAYSRHGIEQRGQLSVLLADVYGKIGQIEEGLQLIAGAEEEMQASGERWWETALYRVKGELLLQHEGVRGWKGEGVKENDSLVTPSPPHPLTRSSPEACFQRAIAVARNQGAKSSELRATIDLARLWREQRKLDEARAVLADIYDWFTEGFDTPDLIEARTLLEELGTGERVQSIGKTGEDIPLNPEP